jgi:NADH:ubiquinone oxidoreductase subunit F (NADH-binding)
MAYPTMLPSPLLVTNIDEMGGTFKDRIWPCDPHMIIEGRSSPPRHLGAKAFLFIRPSYETSADLRARCGSPGSRVLGKNIWEAAFPWRSWSQRKYICGEEPPS